MVIALLVKVAERAVLRLDAADGLAGSQPRELAHATRAERLNRYGLHALRLVQGGAQPIVGLMLGSGLTLAVAVVMGDNKHGAVTQPTGGHSWWW